MSLLPYGHQGGMFIEARIDAVTECLVRWGNEEKVNIGTHAERAKMPLEEAWQHVAQRAFTPDRAVLIPVGGWTAFFDNHANEWLAAAELYILCERLRATTCFFLYEDRPERGEHRGSAQFNCCRYAGGEFPVRERQVTLLKENGWRFQETGDALPFERLDQYALPKKRDRLNPAVLRASARRLAFRAGRARLTTTMWRCSDGAGRRRRAPTPP